MKTTDERRSVNPADLLQISPDLIALDHELDRRAEVYFDGPAFEREVDELLSTPESQLDPWQSPGKLTKSKFGTEILLKEGSV